MIVHDPACPPTPDSSSVGACAEPPRPREIHPLFPRTDRSPEDRDIQYVTFVRRSMGDPKVRHCPEDLPASEVRSWDQVKEWWGGGFYRAIAKDSQHRFVAAFPAGRGWFRIDGRSKPFTRTHWRIAVGPSAPKPRRTRRPRLLGGTPEATALWALLCAEDAVRESLLLGKDLEDFLLGQAAAYRAVGMRLLRLIAARSLKVEGAGQ